MGPIPPYGHKAPMLLGASGAPRFQEIFESLGMRMEIVSADRVGRAAAVKMFRSIVYKGIEALLFECVLGAGQYGAEERVFASLKESLPEWIGRSSRTIWWAALLCTESAALARWTKLRRTLEELGIEPLMATATARRFDWVAESGLREKFGGEFPATYQEVLEALSETTAAQ